MEFANNILDGFYSFTTTPNQLMGTIVSLSLVLYGGLAGPKLPTVFKKLFENTYFKFFILSLVAYSSVKDYKVSLLLAFAFTFSISMFDNRYLSECFAELEKNREQFGNHEKECSSKEQCAADCMLKFGADKQPVCKDNECGCE